jgi:urate oxidase
VSEYAHIHKACVSIEQLRWSRINIADGDGGASEHPHAFLRDGEDKRTTEVKVCGNVILKPQEWSHGLLYIG